MIRNTYLGFLLFIWKLTILIGSIIGQLFSNCFSFSIFKTKQINLTTEYVGLGKVEHDCVGIYSRRQTPICWTKRTACFKWVIKYNIQTHRYTNNKLNIQKNKFKIIGNGERNGRRKENHYRGKPGSSVSRIKVFSPNL